jgi:hypothetical protein
MFYTKNPGWGRFLVGKWPQDNTSRGGNGMKKAIFAMLALGALSLGPSAFANDRFGIRVGTGVVVNPIGAGSVAASAFSLQYTLQNLFGPDAGLRLYGTYVFPSILAESGIIALQTDYLYRFSNEEGNQSVFLGAGGVLLFALISNGPTIISIAPEVTAGYEYGLTPFVAMGIDGTAGYVLPLTSGGVQAIYLLFSVGLNFKIPTN